MPSGTMKLTLFSCEIMIQYVISYFTYHNIPSLIIVAKLWHTSSNTLFSSLPIFGNINKIIKYTYLTYDDVQITHVCNNSLMYVIV